MSLECKNRFEVQKIVIEAILRGLEAFGFQGWDCMEFGQASFQKADKIVLVNLLKASRVGWLGERYDGGVQSDLTRVDEWIEQQNWQIHVILKRKNSGNTVNTILSEDVATMLITWFNGRGAEFLRPKGIAPLRIDANSLIVYNDDSSVYQKRSTFTVKLQVPKEIGSMQISLDAIKPDILPV